ncbi:hypothetical protein ScalyP_jg658 [Parmales sp. scaly parma]|nr:hypothetical protein ScalyP_jg658 [Parmales sp. scaly parma]
MLTNFVRKERRDEGISVFRGEGVMDGKNAVVAVTGVRGMGIEAEEMLMLGKKGPRKDERGLRVVVSAVVVNGELRKAEGVFKMEELIASGYKGSWGVEPSDGTINYKMELRHVKRMLRNMVFVRREERGKEKEIEKEKETLGIRLIAGTPTIFKTALTITGHRCLVGVKWSRGALLVRVTIASEGVTKTVRLSEENILECGWKELAGQITNSTEEKLKMLVGKLEVVEGGGVKLRKRKIGEALEVEEKTMTQSLFEFYRVHCT